MHNPSKHSAGKYICNEQVHRWPLGHDSFAQSHRGAFTHTRIYIYTIPYNTRPFRGPFRCRKPTERVRIHSTATTSERSWNRIRKQFYSVRMKEIVRRVTSLWQSTFDDNETDTQPLVAFLMPNQGMTVFR